MDARLERAAIFLLGTALGFAAAAALDRRAVSEPVVPVADGDKNPRLAAAGRKGIAASGMNSERFRCSECELESTAGPLTRHQQAKEHAGRVRV